MPGPVNANYSADFQKFVNIANKNIASGDGDKIVRLGGNTLGDFKGVFASFWRTSEMKDANNQVRDLFKKTIADMFGGEKFIPDVVRDNMKLEDFGKGKPLTSRRIQLVKTAIDTLGGGKFEGGASVERARTLGYLPSEMPKLARVANLYQQATGCSDADAEKAALDPQSNARRLFDCGGRFTLNADNFKKGLELMDKCEAHALENLANLTSSMPGKDEAVARSLIKDALAMCGDDFDMKDIVSKRMYSVCINGAGKLRPREQIQARIDAMRSNLDEIREAANGNAAIEKAGIVFVESLHGKSVPPGIAGRVARAAIKMDVGSFAKLTPSSTPAQILRGVIDIRDAVSKLMNDEKLNDHLEGSDEFTAVRDLVASVALAKIPPSRLASINAAMSSENAQKTMVMLDEIARGRVNNIDNPVSGELRVELTTHAFNMRGMLSQYDIAVKNHLGLRGDGVPDYNGDFDVEDAGMLDVFEELRTCARNAIAEKAEMDRQSQNVLTHLDAAKANAVNAYSKAGEGNAKKVDSLVLAALKRCAANADAVKVVADNIDTLLVTNDAKLRSIADVRKRAEAVAANFAELQALAKDTPAVYEAGKAMMRGMGGKALPAGMIAKLVQAAANAKIDSIRKLSSRSSGLDIHHAVTQLRDNLVRAMSASGAEEAAGGPDEKQACRNFLAALMMHRCGEKALNAMNGAFAGETAGKMLALYSAIANGQFNEGLERQVAVRLEDQAGSHMTHLAVLKDALVRALGQPGGAGLIPYGGDLNADEIGGPAIFDDLVSRAAQ